VEFQLGIDCSSPSAFTGLLPLNFTFKKPTIHVWPFFDNLARFS
jgi:hypothetical protein